MSKKTVSTSNVKVRAGRSFEGDFVDVADYGFQTIRVLLPPRQKRWLFKQVDRLIYK